MKPNTIDHTQNSNCFSKMKLNTDKIALLDSALLCYIHDPASQPDPIALQEAFERREEGQRGERGGKKEESEKGEKRRVKEGKEGERREVGTKTEGERREREGWRKRSHLFPQVLPFSSSEFFSVNYTKESICHIVKLTISLVHSTNPKLSKSITVYFVSEFFSIHSEVHEINEYKAVLCRKQTTNLMLL